jgi:hypothetical protein
VRERTLASVIVPAVLMYGAFADEIVRGANELQTLRMELAEKILTHRRLVEQGFGGDGEFRPTGFGRH